MGSNVILDSVFGGGEHFIVCDGTHPGAGNGIICHADCTSLCCTDQCGKVRDPAIRCPVGCDFASGNTVTNSNIGLKRDTGLAFAGTGGRHR